MKLSRHDIQKLEDYWINLHQYKKDLKFREWELLNAYQEADTNIGGGKTNRISDTTGNKAILLAEDKRYQYLRSVVETIERLYPELDDDKKTIVRMKYWDKEECYEWIHISDELFMSVQRVLRKRNALLDETARRLGWM